MKEMLHDWLTYAGYVSNIAFLLGFTVALYRATASKRDPWVVSAAWAVGMVAAVALRPLFDAWQPMAFAYSVAFAAFVLWSKHKQQSPAAPQPLGVR